MRGIYLKAWAKERMCGTVKIKGIKINFLKMVMVAVLLYISVQAIFKSGIWAKEGDGGKDFSTMFWDSVALTVEEKLYDRFVPVLVFATEGRSGTNWLIREQIDSLAPLYGYLAADMGVATKAQKYGGMEQDSGQDTGKKVQVLGMEDVAGGEEMVPPDQVSEGERLAELLKAENAVVDEADDLVSNRFVPHEKLNALDLTKLSDYETLLKEFYTVDANTSASGDRLNVDRLLEKDMTISKEGEEPQILIFHTHSQEGFADSVAGDADTTIVGVGERLAQILEETYGYRVLHHTGEYDKDFRDDAYSEALPEITEILEENPSIQVVLDLHRDSMPEGTKLVMDLDGRPTARFMFFNGLSRTRTTGNISYLYNENLEGNLAFSFQMQKAAVEYYPGLTRKIYLKGYRYNMHLKDKFLLVELGAQNNTLEEALNACDPLAHILDLVLTGEGR